MNSALMPQSLFKQAADFHLILHVGRRQKHAQHSVKGSVNLPPYDPSVKKVRLEIFCVQCTVYIST